MDVSTVLLTACVVAFTAVAAYTDWRWGKLPNWLTVSCFATALVFHFCIGLLGFDGQDGGLLLGLNRLMWALLGFATGFGILFVLWLTAGGLGGDVKLMGAIGAWLMPMTTLYVFIVACIFVAALMVGSMTWKVFTGKWSQARKQLGKDGAKSKKASSAKEQNPWRRAIPFGVPVALATWGVLVFQLIQGK
jgi:prepilin peptidase CpaA